jgi:hypothetical protein
MKWISFQKDNLFILSYYLFCSLVIFAPVLQGYSILNGKYLFNFEPWSSMGTIDNVLGQQNPILSDHIDWPNIYYYIQQLRNLEIPLWGSNEQLGKPAIFLMINLLTDPIRLLVWTIFDVPIGTNIETIVKFTAGAFFTHKYLNLIGVQKYLSLIATIGFAYGSSNIAQYQNTYAFAPLSIPIILYWIEKQFKSPSRKNEFFIIFSIFYLMSLGTASIIVFTLVWIGIYYFFRSISVFGKINYTSFKYILYLVISIALSAWYLIPSADYFLSQVNLTYRNSYNNWQLDPFGLILLLIPHYFGSPINDAQNWTIVRYIPGAISTGIFIPIGLLLSSINIFSKKKNFFIKFYVSSSAVLLLYVYSFPFEKIESWINLLPLYKNNPPIHHNSIFQFSLFIGGVLGIQIFYEYAKKQNIKVNLVLASLISIYLTIIVALGSKVNHRSPELDLNYFNNYYFPRFVLIICAQVIFIGFILYTYLRSNVDKKVRGILLYSLFAVLTITVLSENKLNSKDWVPFVKPENWFPSTTTTKYLDKNLGNGRVLGLDFAAIPETMSFYGFPVAVGRGSVPVALQSLLEPAWPNAYDHPTQSLIYSDNFDPNAKIWKLLNVKYFIGARNLNTENIQNLQFVDVIKLEDSTLLSIAKYDNFIFLTDKYQTFDGVEDLKYKFNNIEYDPLRTTLLDINESKNNKLKNIDECYNKKIISINRKTNSIKLIIENSCPVIVNISQYHFPGWNVKINGERKHLFETYGFMSSIYVERTGINTIELNYMPKTFVYGCLISISTLILLVIFYTWNRRVENNELIN